MKKVFPTSKKDPTAIPKNSKLISNNKQDMGYAILVDTVQKLSMQASFELLG